MEQVCKAKFGIAHPKPRPPIDLLAMFKISLSTRNRKRVRAKREEGPLLPFASPLVEREKGEIGSRICGALKVSRQAGADEIVVRGRVANRIPVPIIDLMSYPVERPQGAGSPGHPGGRADG